MNCSICDMDLDGFIYYEKAGFRVCHFCHNGLERKGDDEGVEVKLGRKSVSGKEAFQKTYTVKKVGSGAHISVTRSLIGKEVKLAPVDEKDTLFTQSITVSRILEVKDGIVTKEFINKPSFSDHEDSILIGVKTGNIYSRKDIIKDIITKIIKEA
jgi:hypothetical protein